VKRKVLFVFVALIFLPFIARFVTYVRAQDRKFDNVSDAPTRKVAIVFGAGVRNGYPTTMLYDRVASAVDLYRAGKVSKLLMSGDNRFENYNEPAAMRRAAIQLGVPNDDIVLDHAGRSTYETCYRAKEIFGVTQAVLVTQDFHLDRAILLCDHFGIDAVGFIADRRDYRFVRWNELREIPATLNALLEMWITKPMPVLGEKIVID
jgi:vancomycin permeability regulator SanA